MADRFTSKSMAGIRFVAQRGLLKPLVWRLARVTVFGKENLRGLTGPFVAVANHSSHLDAPLVIGSLPMRHSRYLAAGAAADYFFDVPWRKWLTTLFFNAFPVDRRGTGKRSGISKALLMRGVPILIFPEGGRAKDSTMGKFKPGAAALAAAVGVPCLPIAIVGASEAMPRGRNWPVPGRPPIAVAIGEPLRHKLGETAEDFTGRIVREIERLRDARIAAMPQFVEEG